MERHIVIRLDISSDEPEETKLDRSILKSQVYAYLRELIEDDSLEFEIEEFFENKYERFTI